MKQKSVGIFVSGGRTVVILVWENGACAIFDSHRHFQYGCVLSHSLPSKEKRLNIVASQDIPEVLQHLNTVCLNHLGGVQQKM